MSMLGNTIEVGIVIAIIIFASIAFSLATNKHFFGTHFPVIDLIRRLLKRDTRKKAVQQVLHASLFFILLLAGILFVIVLDRMINR